jgi:hypothetical protein
VPKRNIFQFFFSPFGLFSDVKERASGNSLKFIQKTLDLVPQSLNILSGAGCVFRNVITGDPKPQEYHNKVLLH